MALAQQQASAPLPPADPCSAIARSYRFERARRTLRLEHREESRRADRRFWLAIAALLAVVAAIAGAVIDQLQQLFGI